MDETNDRSPDERAFLAEYDARPYERPSLTVDVALLTIRDRALWAVLLRREEHPDRGRWALPGGFVGLDESLDSAAARVLREKVGLEGVFLEQLYTFGDPGRDPRTRVVTVAYYALVPEARLAAIASGSLARLYVPWSGEEGGPVQALDPSGAPLPLAFDHAAILGMTVKRLRGKLDYAPIGYELLGERFTLRDLQLVHETISGRRLNKDSFRRRMLASGQLEPTAERATAVAYRPPELYRFAGTEGGQAGRSGAATAVLFVCQHGAAKSPLAAVSLEAMARARGLAVHAKYAGTEPEAEVVSAVVEAARRERLGGLLIRPRLVDAADAAAADRVVAFGVDVPAPPGTIVERWDDVPAVTVDPDAARAAIDRHVAALLDELEQQPADPR